MRDFVEMMTLGLVARGQHLLRRPSPVAVVKQDTYVPSNRLAGPSNATTSKHPTFQFFAGH